MATTTKRKPGRYSRTLLHKPDFGTVRVVKSDTALPSHKHVDENHTDSLLKGTVSMTCMLQVFSWIQGG